jgi:hypothetical protein
MVRQPKGAATFLFTDIESSTRLIEDVGEARYSTTSATRDGTQILSPERLEPRELGFASRDAAP